MNEVFHQGECRIQQVTGEEVMASLNGRMIADTIMRGAFRYISNQPMVIISSVDAQRSIWASVLVGEVGFIQVPDETTITLNLSMLRSVKDDIFFRNIAWHSPIGMLFMEPATRKRFRVNGQANLVGNLITVSVKEAYPNCPKYIQKRTVIFSESRQATRSQSVVGTSLQPSEIAWISAADTLFVGSAGADGRMDASHRGGGAGFVEVLDQHTLKIPDYVGNGMYNTLGNFVQNPKAGIIFMNFQQGSSLQLTGRAELLFDQNTENDLERTTGTGRYWLFRTDEWICTQNHHRAAWKFVEYSPFNP